MSGLWGFYFLAKVFLYLRGHLRFHFAADAFLAAVVLLPVPKNRPRAALASRLRTAAACLLAFLFLWRDSWLPPLGYTLRFLAGPGTSFSPRYAMAFLQGWVNPWDLFALLELFVVCWAAGRRFNLAWVVIPVLCLSGFHSRGDATIDALDPALSRFYAAQSQELVKFPAKPAPPDFDIVLVHVCSLSWDDLKVSGFEKDPFWNRFQLLFTRYNSAASYSGPAAIRLLRSPCGQTPEKDLYRAAPAGCYLLDDLRAAGYATYSAWDTPGRFDQGGRWDDQVRVNGHAAAALDDTGLPVDEVAFDREPMADTYAVLERWWEKRQASRARRAVLFYNTIMLHAGTRWKSDPRGFEDPVRQYRESLAKLFGDLERFDALLRASGRNVVVVFVPEHGRGLRGSVMQPRDYRHIPLPELTLVPLGIELIGPKAPAGGRPILVSKPAGAEAVAYLLAAFLKEPPFTGAGLSATLMEGIPETPFVAENSENTVMESGGRYYFRRGDERWAPVPTSVLSFGALAQLVRRGLSEWERGQLSDLAQVPTPKSNARRAYVDPTGTRVVASPDDAPAAKP